MPGLVLLLGIDGLALDAIDDVGDQETQPVAFDEQGQARVDGVAAVQPLVGQLGALYPDDPDRRAWLRAQDCVAIANRVLARHGRDDGGRVLADAIRVLAWTHETVKRWDAAGVTPVVA